MSFDLIDTKGLTLESRQKRQLRKKERIPGLADRMRRARIAASLTQEQLADALTVNRRTVYTWESGRSEPTVARLEEIANILGESFSWFMHGEGDDRTDRINKLRLRIEQLPNKVIDVLEEFLSTLENTIERG